MDEGNIELGMMNVFFLEAHVQLFLGIFPARYIATIGAF